MSDFTTLWIKTAQIPTVMRFDYTDNFPAIFRLFAGTGELKSASEILSPNWNYAGFSLKSPIFGPKVEIEKFQSYRDIIEGLKIM